jgi:hypothetical protein
MCAALEGEKRYTCGDMARLTSRFASLPAITQNPEMSANVIGSLWIAVPDTVLSASALRR